MGTWRGMAIGLFVMAVGSVGCSSNDATVSSGTESVAPAVVGTLPGETVSNATNRLLKECYLQKFGIVAEEVDGGIEVDMTDATTPTLGYQDISFFFGGRHGGQGDAPPQNRFAGTPQDGAGVQREDLHAPAPDHADRYIPRRAAVQNSGRGLDLRL